MSSSDKRWLGEDKGKRLCSPEAKRRDRLTFPHAGSSLKSLPRATTNRPPDVVEPEDSTVRHFDVRPNLDPELALRHSEAAFHDGMNPPRVRCRGLLHPLHFQVRILTNV
jgi:hypothetical protein